MENILNKLKLTSEFFLFAVQYFENNRGVPKIYLNGFFYRLNTRAPSNLHWSCDLRPKLKCRSALRTDPAAPFVAKVLATKHNHGPNHYKKLDKLKLITNPKRIINNMFIVKKGPQD